MDSKPPNEDLKDPLERAKQDPYDSYYQLKVEVKERPQDFAAPDLITPADVLKEVAEDNRIANLKQQYRFATLSKSAYDVYYESPSFAEKEVKTYFPKHTLVPSLTDKNSAVWIKEKNDGPSEVVIAYRGTAFKSLAPKDIKSSGEDAIADVDILFGTNVFGRMKEADEKYKDTASYYPDANIITTGHSLGGSQALYVARKHGLEGHVFNTGSSPFGFPQEAISAIKGGSRITSYSVVGDLISLSNRYLDKADKRIIVPNKGVIGFTSHDMSNFLPNKILKKSESEWIKETPINKGIPLKPPITNKMPVTRKTPVTIGGLRGAPLPVAIRSLGGLRGAPLSRMTSKKPVFCNPFDIKCKYR